MRVTGLSKGNLSVQLVNLEQAGLVVITKDIVDRKMRTRVKLSKTGAAEIEQYWHAMDNIRARMVGQEKSSAQSAAVRIGFTLSPSTR